MRFFGIAAGVTGLTISAAFAQPASQQLAHYLPADRASRLEARPPGIRLGLGKAPEIALAPLSDPEVARLAESGPRLRTAFGRHPRGVPRATQAGGADPADVCHLDPNRFPEWQGAMSSVAQLTFEEGGDQYLCSGSLVATTANFR
jgi:hypothetical protein